MNTAGNRNGGIVARTLCVALCTALYAIAAPIAHAQSTAAAESVRQYDIPAGSLSAALSAWGAQSDRQLVFAPDLISGKQSKGVSGRYGAEQALTQLLAGTGLTWERVNGQTIAIKRVAAPAAEPQAKARSTPTTEQSAELGVQDLEKMTVTGTRIRGAQSSSPLLLISQEEMRLAGHNNLGDVIRAIPQNFSGGQNPGIQVGAGGGAANSNLTGAASLNLRGLGPDATLTLLNGARLPYDGSSQATDVAMIPVAAIDRMEVLLDGASAIYGSDAVGGVANIVLKRDYEGAEVTTRYGEASGGGYDHTQVTAVAGTTWQSGDVLIAAEAQRNDAIYASQRDYLNYLANGEMLMIYPKMSQKGLLVSGHQALGERVELAFDGFYTKRSMDSFLLTTSWIKAGADTDIYGLSPSLTVGLKGDWSMRLYAFLGKDEAETSQQLISLATGVVTPGAGQMYQNRAKAAGVEFEGALFSLPAGETRVSVGAGWRETEFDWVSLTTGASTAKGETAAHHVYGEINVPLISENQGYEFIRYLSVNGAVRYEDYDTFGDTTTPKIGLFWKVSPSVDVRASWGKSFKAPVLALQNALVQATLRRASSLGIQNVPADATVISLLGGNPDLEPEGAEAVTAGITFRPSFLPGASIELGWFDIDYTERVVQPFQFPNLSFWGQTLGDPVYAQFVTANPSGDQQAAGIAAADRFDNFTAGLAYNPENVIAIFDNRQVNAASQRMQGIDLNVRHSIPLQDSSLALSAGGSWITSSRRQLVQGTPDLDIAGIAAFPPKFKGYMGLSWSRSQWTISTNINHLDGVTDTRVSPTVKGDSMTMVDFVVDYAAVPGFFGGLGFQFAIANAFNESPPFLSPGQPYYVNYDSTNYSPRGRVVSFALTKKF